MAYGKYNKQFVILTFDGDLVEGFAVKTYCYLKTAINSCRNKTVYADHQLDYLARYYLRFKPRKPIKIIEINFKEMTIKDVEFEEQSEINNKMLEFNDKVRQVYEQKYKVEK